MRNVVIDTGPLVTLQMRDKNLADATLIWLGHETGLREIMTNDVKNFARYRLPDGDALEVL